LQLVDLLLVLLLLELLLLCFPLLLLLLIHFVVLTRLGVAWSLAGEQLLALEHHYALKDELLLRTLGRNTGFA
jgi:hypothetical protein